MKVYGKKPITVCGQHVNATHRGTQVFQKEEQGKRGKRGIREGQEAKEEEPAIRGTEPPSTSARAFLAIGARILIRQKFVVNRFFRCKTSCLT